MKFRSAWGLALVTAAALAACGGSSETLTSITIAGKAAGKGTAMARATINVKCTAGTGTIPAGDDGAYTITIAQASLPCALKAAGATGDPLHSVVAGTGNTGTYTANITPLTEMVVAKVAGASPASFYAGVSATTTVSASTVTQAVDYVKTALAGVTALTVDPVAGPLEAAQVTQITTVVDALAAASLTLPEVTAAIVANPTSPTVISAPLASVATSCAWLKSGKYRVINPNETDPLWKAHVIDLDAVALTVKVFDGTVVPFTSNGGCQFTIDDAQETNKIMVSAGGLFVMHTQSKTNLALRSVAIGLPEQTLPVSELAGTWNLASWGPAGGTATGSIAETLEVTLDASGQVTAVSACLGLAACTAEPGPHGKLEANATAGGFDFKESGVAVGRGFLFKSLAGKAAFVLVTNEGQVVVGSRKETLGALPAVGTVNSFRQFTLNGNGTISTLSEDSNTVTAVDATAKTVTRLQASNSRVDTLGFDKPRNGLRYRALNSCTIAGVASNCAEIVQLPLQGMGITLTLGVGTNPTTAFYHVAIGKPAP